MYLIYRPPTVTLKSMLITNVPVCRQKLNRTKYALRDTKTIALLFYLQEDVSLNFYSLMVYNQPHQNQDATTQQNHPAYQGMVVRSRTRFWGESPQTL